MNVTAKPGHCKNSCTIYRKLFKVFLLATFVFSHLHDVKAQVANSQVMSLENIVPPSPNVAAIDKFGNIPVGASTGIPSVSVPIYHWEGQSFGVPVNISLDYHAGGVRVDELASSVGLGWALNAGGVISRTMRGTPDEMDSYGFLVYPMPATSYDGNAPRDASNSDHIFHQMNAGNRDTQSDIFSYNFNGRSGRFTLGKNGDILFLEQAKLKLQKFTQRIDGRNLFVKFIITDEAGYQYVFSDYETTTGDPAKYSQYFTSSWYLSSIVSPSGLDHIDFQYEGAFLHANQTSSTSLMAIPLTYDFITTSADMSGGSSQEVNTKRIKTIIFPDQNTITFDYDGNKRQDISDLSTEKLLKKITIQKGGVSRGYALSQDYSLGGRATLLAVQEVGANQELLNPYTFLYDMSSLPPRFSARQDHWGYPNSNSGLKIPKEYLSVPVGSNGSIYGGYTSFEGGNRDTDPSLVKAGSLTRITYPTGGYTVFEMEANQSNDAWLNFISTTTTADPYDEKSLNIDVNSTQASETSFVYLGDNNAGTEFSYSTAPYYCIDCSLKFELTTVNNGIIHTVIVPLDGAGSSGNITKTAGVQGLVNGTTYKIKAYVLNASNYYGYAEIRWKEPHAGRTKQVDITHIQSYVGGLRAKRVSDYLPGNSIPASVKEYEYTMEDGVTSSGSLGTHPVYSYLVYYDYKYDETIYEVPTYNSGAQNNYIIRCSNSANESPYVNGSPVTYRRIVEKIGSKGAYTGKTVRYFTNFADSAPVFHEVFPAIPPSYYTWSYGLLKKEEIYDSANFLIKKTENDYEYITNPYANDPQRVENFRSISIAPVKFLSPKSEDAHRIYPANDPYYFLSQSFTPLEGRAQLKQSKVTDFSLTGANVLVTNYLYNTDNYLVKEKNIVNSRQQEKKTTYTYPIDFPENPIYNDMVNNHNIISPVIKEKMFTDNILNFTKNTNYRNWSSGVYEPETISSAFQSQQEDIRLRYLKYDAHGNPLSAQQELGAVVNYIWSYGGEHLIAQVNNMNYSAIESLLGGAPAIESFRNQTSPTDTQVTSFLAPLTNAVNNTKSIMMVNFRYNTLSGMTIQTDSKGLTTYYEYDGFQRLKNIKDYQGNILKSFDYNYRPQ